jgi:hypothetical protein
MQDVDANADHRQRIWWVHIPTTIRSLSLEVGVLLGVLRRRGPGPVRSLQDSFDRAPFRGGERELPVRILTGSCRKRFSLVQCSTRGYLKHKTNSQG